MCGIHRHTQGQPGSWSFLFGIVSLNISHKGAFGCTKTYTQTHTEELGQSQVIIGLGVPSLLDDEWLQSPAKDAEMLCHEIQACGLCPSPILVIDDEQPGGTWKVSCKCKSGKTPQPMTYKNIYIYIYPRNQKAV